MAKLQRRLLGEPDNVREVPLARLETYDLGEIRIGRSVLQPGWRWSESIKPIARSEWCEDHHIGYSVSGACRVRMREGAELLIGPDQLYEIPAGHDSWVDGDAPWVSITWQPSTAFVQAEGGDFDRVVATLLVTDIVNSTALALEVGDGAWRDLLARHNLAVRGQLERFRGREVATTGDGFLAIFDGAERAIRAAQETTRAAAELGLEVRAGVHTGELDREGDNVRGVTVHIAARIAALAEAGEVLASWATRELLAGSAISFTDRGLHELKGLSEPRRVYRVEAEARP
ncbi:MAG TPA: adenylate/guanylate cyclase domain-containing protein [Candidatus Limnocylindria bacterium]|nr:adenylate/guanylate cyclase domain-containing protein [Candidatus Limnocylindria bacterium]